MSNFQNLPHEVHESISEFLTSSELKAISHCSYRLLQIYRRKYYHTCRTFIRANKNSVPSYNSYVPLTVLQNPSLFSWFPNQSVSKLIVFSDLSYQHLLIGLSRKENILKNTLAINFQTKDYPSLHTININFPLEINHLFVESQLYSCIKTFINTNDNFLIYPFTLNANSLLLLQPFHDSLSWLKSVKIFITFFHRETNFLSNLDFFLPCLENAELSDVFNSSNISETEHNSILITVLNSIIRSPKLKSFILISSNKSLEIIRVIFDDYVSKLRDDIEKCSILISGSEEEELQTQSYFQTIELPQVTELILSSYSTFIQKYKFPRASFDIYVNVNPIDYYIFASSLQYLTVMNLTVKTILNSHLIGIGRNISKFKHLKRLNFSLDYIENLRISSLLIVKACLAISKNLNNSISLSGQDLFNLIENALSNTKFHNKDVLSNTLFEFYSDPIGFLGTLEQNYVDEKPGLDPLVFLVFQEAFFTAISKMKSLEYFGYRVYDKAFFCYYIDGTSPFPMALHFPNIALQRLLAFPSSLKQVLLYYQTLYSTLNSLKPRYNFFRKRHRVKTGSLNNNAIILSNTFSITPSPCKIYTNAFDDCSRLKILFDFGYPDFKSSSNDIFLCKDLSIPKPCYRPYFDVAIPGFSGWI